jgi:EAL domain-containing protein (putative c-di-GMP-specific phosphodiesterase class I)
MATIPLVDGERAPHASPRGAAGASSARDLVVDDDPATAALGILVSAGYDVRTAVDAATAYRVLESSDVDVLVTDVSRGGIDGIALLRHAREHHGALPVLLMTGAPDFEMATRAMEHGAFHFLLKPFAAERLVGAVELALGLGPSSSTGDAPAPAADNARFDRMLDRLWMAYQPIVRPDGALFAYEALVRSDEDGLSNAGDILDAAERLRRLHDLGRSVRARAGRDVTERGSPHALFVNLHAHELMDDTLVAADGALAAIAPSVVLEITERAALHDVREARARMAELRSMGFRIALDDLGAGYAGLTSFALLEPEIVKLDMGLVRGVEADPVRRSLIRSIVALCRDMGTLVVGEGVETAAERDALIDLGCDLLQGYLFGKPERL